MPPDDHQFMLGQHSARLDNIEKTQALIQVAQIETNAKLDRVLAVTERAKGSWKTLAVIGGSLTVVIESIHQLAIWWHK